MIHCEVSRFENKDDRAARSFFQGKRETGAERRGRFPPDRMDRTGPRLSGRTGGSSARAPLAANEIQRLFRRLDIFFANFRLAWDWWI